MIQPIQSPPAPSSDKPQENKKSKRSESVLFKAITSILCIGLLWKWIFAEIHDAPNHAFYKNKKEKINTAETENPKPTRLSFDLNSVGCDVDDPCTIEDSVCIKRLGKKMLSYSNSSSDVDINSFEDILSEINCATKVLTFNKLPTNQDCRKALRTLSRYHPDNKKFGNQETFQLINYAGNLLCPRPDSPQITE